MDNRHLLIINGEVFLNGKFEKKDIRIEDGRFAEIGVDLGAGALADETQILDATNKYIIPGLVDVHTHGRVGLDFSNITEHALEKLLKSYHACGVTSVVATTMTNEPAKVEESLRIMGEYIKKQEVFCAEQARLLGIHMEGPYLGKEKKGAHDENYLCNPDWEQFERLQKLSGGNIRMVTVDPNIDGAEEFIRKCVETGVKVSLGHTNCDYETAVKVQKLGADHVTHTFNAMNPLHHREPGLIGAAMDSGMYMELICDGIHVHPSLVRMMFAAYPDKVVLVSDSIPAAGMKDGDYESGGLKITLKNGTAMLADGTIAGSSISLYNAVEYAVNLGVSMEHAVNSATYLAAKSIGMEDVAGSIEVGRKAEFLVVEHG